MEAAPPLEVGVDSRAVGIEAFAAEGLTRDRDHKERGEDPKTQRARRKPRDLATVAASPTLDVLGLSLIHI